MAKKVWLDTDGESGLTTAKCEECEWVHTGDDRDFASKLGHDHYTSEHQS